MNIYCRRPVLGHLLRLTLIVVLCFLTMPTPANGKKKNHGPYWEWKIKGNMQALVKKEKGKGKQVLTPFKYIANKDNKGKYIKGVGKMMSCKRFNGSKRFLIPVKGPNGWGLIDCDGHEVLACQFNDIHISLPEDFYKNDYQQALLKVKDEKGMWGMALITCLNNGKYSITTHDNKPLNPSSCIYDKVEMVYKQYVLKKDFGTSEVDVDGIMCVLYKNKKCALYIDGKPLTPCIYDIGSVVSNEKWLLSNNTDLMKMPKLITCIKGKDWKDNTYVMKCGGKLHFISRGQTTKTHEGICKDGTVLPKFSLYESGQNAYVMWDSGMSVTTNDKTNVGYQSFDIANRRILWGQVDNAPFKTIKTDGNDVALLKWGDTFSLINLKSGRELLNKHYSQKIQTYSDGSGFISLSYNNATLASFITRGGNHMVVLDSPNQLAKVAETVRSVGKFDILRHAGGYGLHCHATGKTLACNLDTVYEAGKAFAGLFVIKRNQFYGLADRNGIVLPPIFYTIVPRADSVVAISKGWGLEYEKYVRKTAEGTYCISSDNSQTLLYAQTDITDSNKEYDMFCNLQAMANWVEDEPLKALSYYVHGMRLEINKQYLMAVNSYTKALEMNVPCQAEIERAKKKLTAEEAAKRQQQQREELLKREEEQRRQQEQFAAQQEAERQRQERLQQVINVLQQSTQNLQQLNQRRANDRRYSNNPRQSSGNVGHHSGSSEPSQRTTTPTTPPSKKTRKPYSPSQKVKRPWDDYGKTYECTLCRGSKKCVFCRGHGKTNGFKCKDCKTTGICPRCKGAGVLTR